MFIYDFIDLFNSIRLEKFTINTEYIEIFREGYIN